MAVSVDRLDREARAGLKEALGAPRYELVPTASARPAAEQLPPGCKVTITASPRRGQDATIDLAVELSLSGFSVAPHIAARLIRDGPHLGEVLRRLSDSGIDEIFVIGGDGHPQGEYSAALEVIRVVEESELTFSVGVAGYPEQHPLIEASELIRVLFAKQSRASYVTTQMCFDAGTVIRWIEQMRGRGLVLPVLIGVPGAVALTRLIPVAGRIGVGDSLRFLRRHRGMWRRLISPNYTPTRLLLELAPALADPQLGVAGLHFYTFNQVADTEQWRQRTLNAL